MKITEEQFLIYYKEGLKDSEISRLTGESASIYSKYRKENNLPPNGRIVVSDEEFKNLYSKGYTDSEIAEITKASQAQIVRRRKKFNLPPNDFLSKYKEIILQMLQDGKTDPEIARSINVSENAVTNYRNSLGITKNYKKSIDIEQLTALVKEGKSDSEIADIMGFHKSWIKRNRLKLKLLKGERIMPKVLNITEDQFQVFLGSMLGDGHFRKTSENGGVSLIICHCAKQKSYLEYKKQILGELANDIYIKKITDYRFKNPEYEEVYLSTKANLDLVEFYNNWYTPKKEVYAEDLYKITPLGLAIWYMDDGSKIKEGGGLLCTNAFSIESLKIIQEMFLTKFDIKVSIYEKSHQIYIPVKEFIKFAELIKPYIIEDMYYKLGHLTP